MPRPYNQQKARSHLLPLYSPRPQIPKSLTLTTMEMTSVLVEVGDGDAGKLTRLSVICKLVSEQLDALRGLLL